MTPPPPMPPLAVQKQRILILSALRGVGVIVMLLGMLLWFTDLRQPGGDPLVGGLLFILGMAESFILPVVLARRWKTRVP